MLPQVCQPSWLGWMCRPSVWAALALLLVLSGCLGRLQPTDRLQLARDLATRQRWQPAAAKEASAVRIALPDPRVLSLGRLPLGSDSPGPEGGVLLSWPGSELRAQFHATRLTLELRTIGEVHFDVWIDDQRSLLSPDRDAWRRYTLTDLPNRPHQLRLQKRTEAAAGTVKVRAIELAAGGGLLPPAALPSRRLEFIGDSMTVGACVLDDGAEDWGSRLRHCHRLSYAARVADALLAQHRAIAVSGLGVRRSQVPFVAHDLFDRQLPRADSPVEPPDAFQPDAVIILLGHNDVLVSQRAGEAFPATFAADYVRLVRAVRRRYPRSLILCLTGGMHGSLASRPLRRAFRQALAELQAHDPRILSHRLAAWSFLHPRAHTQAAIAAEITPILRRYLGWSQPT